MIENEASTKTYLIHRPSGLRVRRLCEFANGEVEVEFPRGARITLISGVLLEIEEPEVEVEGG